MIHETLTVKQVATLKGVSETAIRDAVNDPLSPLCGVKDGGRLFILSSTVEAYVPRSYPRKERE